MLASFIVGAVVGAVFAVKLTLKLQALGFKKLKRDGRLKLNLDGKELE